MSLFDLSLLQQGGPLMWPIFLLSLFGFVIFIERALFLHRGQISTDNFLAGIKNLLRKHRVVEALTVCEETPGPVAAIVKAALLRHDQGEARMVASVQAAALVEIPALERRIATLLAIARIAPLLGLLGTLASLATTLLTATESSPYPSYQTFAAGFGQALLTSAAGLALAILSYLAFHFLNGRLRALLHDMEFAGHDIVEFLAGNAPEPLPGDPHA